MPHRRHAAATTQTDQAVSQSPAAPRPESGASHQGGSSGPAPASSGGLSVAAAAAVAQIRRRRTVATSSRAPGRNAAASAALLQNQSAHLAPIVLSSAPGDAVLAQNASPEHRVPDDAMANVDSTAPSGHESPAGPSPGPGTQPAHELPTMQGRAEAPDASVPAPDLERVQGTQRPPLPFHSMRRSARLHKSPDASSSAVHADTATAVQSPHALPHATAAAESPVTR